MNSEGSWFGGSVVSRTIGRDSELEREKDLSGNG